MLLNNILFPFNFIGYKIIDIKYGEMGEIKDIIEIPNNSLIKISRKNKEYLVPFTNEIIIKADKKKRILEIDAPDGIFELND